MFNRLCAYEANSWRQYQEQEVVKKNAIGFNNLNSKDRQFASFSLIDGHSQRSYSQEISILFKPWIKEKLKRLFGNDLTQLILDYSEWYHLALDSSEERQPFTIYIGYSAGGLSYQFIGQDAINCSGTIRWDLLPPNCPRSMPMIVQSKDAYLSAILKNISPLCHTQLGYHVDQLIDFFNLGMVLDYIEFNRQKYELMFDSLGISSNSTKDMFKKFSLIAEDCIEFYQLQLDYFLKNKKMASLFIKNMHVIIKSLLTMDANYGPPLLRKYFIQYLGLVFTAHLSKDLDIWLGLFTEGGQDKEKTSYPFKQALLHGIIEITKACGQSEHLTLNSLPPLWPMDSVLMKRIDNSKFYHIPFGSDYDDSRGETLCEYYFKHVYFFSIHAAFKNPSQREAFHNLQSIVREIIGIPHYTNIEYSTIAIKALTFAIKLQGNISPQNQVQLKKEYEELHQEITLYPRLQKIAAALEIFFGSILDLLFNGCCRCNVKPFGALLSNGLFRWQNANLSQNLEKISTSYFSP